jgi:aspartate-semialdehyde dehydrogenase
MMRETSKILGEDIPVDVTCVRVPVFTGHAESVVVQTREPVDIRAAMTVLRDAPGVRVHEFEPPTPSAIAGTHEVHVGRVRASRSFERGLQLWVVADNLLKGAAWNAVQIAESLLGRKAVR